MYIYMWNISTCWCWGIPSLLVSVPFNRCFESHPPPWHIRFHEVNFCTSESEKRNFGLQRSNILGNSTGFGDSFFYIYIHIHMYIYICIYMYNIYIFIWLCISIYMHKVGLRVVDIGVYILRRPFYGGIPIHIHQVVFNIMVKSCSYWRLHTLNIFH